MRFSFQASLGCIALLLFGGSSSPAAELNRPAPNFTLSNTHHQRRSLSSYKGDVLLINFWASWCAPCQIELPELHRLAAENSHKKLRVLAINIDRDRSAADHLLTKLGLQNAAFKVLWDTDSKVVRTYDIETLPASFIVDRHGVIRFIHAGFHAGDPATWRKEINELLTPPS